MPQGKTITVLNMVDEQVPLDHHDEEVGEIAMHYPGLSPNNSGATQAWVSLLHMKPGRKSTFHVHLENDEFFFVISGNGHIHEKVDGEVHSYPIGPNSIMVAPMGIAKQIENTGDEMMSVLQVFAPPPDAKTLEQIVENHEITVHEGGGGRLVQPS